MSSILIDPAKFKEFEHKRWQDSINAYDKFFGPLTRLTIEALLDTTHVTSGTHVLDVASGPGYVAAAARLRDAHVVGIDFSENMILRARDVNDKSISFEVGDAEALAFSDGTFDSVIMNFGLLHLGQPEKAVKEAWRVLKVNGHFGFTVWTKPDEAIGFALILRAVEMHGSVMVPLPPGPPFFWLSEESECERLLKEAGFTGPSIIKLPLLWKLHSIDEFFEAFLDGTARTGGLLRAQSPNALRAIRDAVRQSCLTYQVGDGLSIPMPALVVSATKASNGSMI